MRVRRACPWLLSTFVLATAACGGSGGRTPQVVAFSFAPVDPATDVLTQADVDAVVAAAASSNNAGRLAIAVIDRIGNVLRIWNRNASSTLADCDNRTALSLARAAAYLSHSQAPLTSRTGQFISTFHFPPTFNLDTYLPGGTDCAPIRQTSGVASTPQGPLWQIDASNRGARIATTQTVPPTAFDPGKSIPQLTNPDGSVPSPGLTALPGGVPLYKRTAASIANPGQFDVERRLAGAIGVYSTDGVGKPLPELAEYAAFAGSQAVNPTTGEDYTFGPIPFEGAVFLVGVLLPYVKQPFRPLGFSAGVYNASFTVFTSGGNGSADPTGWLISPRDQSAGARPFSANEVRTIIMACVDTSLRTHAAIRLPAQSACQMIITITDSQGVLLGAFRMDDATLFSLEISISKARNTFYYSDPASIDLDGPNAGKHPLNGIVPPGTAITCRTLGFLSQPRFPPTIDSSKEPGPLHHLALENRRKVRYNQMGFAPPAANDTQSGIIFFPGSAPLYRDGTLIGGIGVSGDGVEQDDLVTARGIAAAQRLLGFQLEPDPKTRCDNFTYSEVRLPYFKFPQNPDG